LRTGGFRLVVTVKVMRMRPMKQTPPNGTAEQHVREIRRKTRNQYSSEEKIRIVISGLRGEHSIAERCRREGIAESLYYVWSKEFMEAGKKRLAG
jgi:transposase